MNCRPNVYNVSHFCRLYEVISYKIKFKTSIIWYNLHLLSQRYISLLHTVLFLFRIYETEIKYKRRFHHVPSTLSAFLLLQDNHKAKEREKVNKHQEGTSLDWNNVLLYKATEQKNSSNIFFIIVICLHFFPVRIECSLITIKSVSVIQTSMLRFIYLFIYI